MINQPKSELVKQSLPYQEPQNMSGPINQIPYHYKGITIKKGDN